MNSGAPRFKRNFIVASVAHVAMITGVVLWEGIAPWRSDSQIGVEVVVPADILGDMPQGEGTGRGAYSLPKLGGPTEASFATPNENTLATDETVAPKVKPRPVDSGSVSIPKKDVKKPVAKKVEKPAPKVVPKPTTMAKAGVKGTATGSPIGESAADIRNRLERKLQAKAGGTPYGDNQKAGGGEGRSSVIGSRYGSADGIANGVGKGTPFWWYYEHVHDKMYEAWQQPAESMNWDKRRFSTIVIKVARNGEVLGARLQTPSGNAAMDNSALAAARSVGKLQPLPDGLGGATAEISINFQLEG